jgi:hypothetical protein
MAPTALGEVARMTLTRNHVREVIATYIKAWVSQDPDLIVTIFTPGATYHEGVMGQPIPDREAVFDDLAKGVRKRLRETAILTFKGGLISSLSEYWSSQAVAQLGSESQRQQ